MSAFSEPMKNRLKVLLFTAPLLVPLFTFLARTIWLFDLHQLHRLGLHLARLFVHRFRKLRVHG